MSGSNGSVEPAAEVVEPKARIRLTTAQKRALPVVFFVSVCGVGGAALIPPALPTIADDFGVARTTAAFLLTINTLPGIVLAPVAGILSDRIGRKMVLVPSLLIFGLAGGLGAFAPSFGWLLVSRFIQGIGAAGMINLAVTILGDMFDGAQRTRMIGYNAGFLTLGTTSFPSIGGFLTAIDWRWVFYVYWSAIPIAVIALVVLPKTAVIRPDTAVVGGPFETLRIAAVRRIVIRGGLVFVIIFGAILTGGPLLLAERFGASPAAIGLTLTVAALFSMAGAINTGRIRERLHPAKTLALSAIFYTIGLVLIAFAFSIWIAAVGFMVCGIGEGLSIALLQTRATEVAPPGRRGTVVALWVSSARIGQTIGPVMAKAGIDAFGLTIGSLAFAAVSGSMVASSAYRIRHLGAEAADEAEDESAGEPIGDETVITSERLISPAEPGSENE